MNIKKISILLALIPFSTFSFQHEPSEKDKQFLASLGLPLPDSGIHIVPRSVMGLPDEIIEKGDIEKAQMNNRGYAIDNSYRPRELLNFNKHAEIQFKMYKDVTRDSSTHIRQSSKDLKLAFEYKGIPKTLVNKNIGFVPQGSFHENGWSGIVQFFEVKNIGTCAYAHKDVKASHTAVELAMEDVTYDVSSKATLKTVRGNKGNGFVYKIEWYDDSSFHELECANMNYSSEITESVINLANEIDNSQI